MYLYSAIYVVVIVVLKVADYLFEFPQIVNIGISFAEFGLGLTLGNRLYKHFVEKRIQLISSNASGNELKIAVAREGGTNIFVAIGLLALGVAASAYYFYVAGLANLYPVFSLR